MGLVVGVVGVIAMGIDRGCVAVDVKQAFVTPSGRR